jgi:hypothetical protein
MWCIKEAVFKWLGERGISFQKNIIILSINNDEQVAFVEVKKDTSSLTINYINSSLNGSYVPYSGATNNVDIGNFNFSSYLISTHILNGHSPILVGDNLTFYNPNGQASLNNVTSICYKDGSCINSSTINNYVPYTGATGNVDFNNKLITNISSISMNSVSGSFSFNESIDYFITHDNTLYQELTFGWINNKLGFFDVVNTPLFVVTNCKDSIEDANFFNSKLLHPKFTVIFSNLGIFFTLL